MAKTKIADVVIPEIFAPYIIMQTKELSEIINSGIAVSNAAIDNFVAGAGQTLNMPFWQPLTGRSKVLSDTDPLTTDKINAGSSVAIKLFRGNAWSTNQLAGALAGDSPMSAIGEQLAKWWASDEQQTFIAILKGIFGGPLASTHVNDISGNTGDAAKISASAILDTKQLLGDAAKQLTTLVTHSAVFTALQKQNLIEYIPNSQGIVNFPTYLGYKIVVDDGCPVASGVYNTYLFSGGCFGRGEALPTDIDAVRIGDDILAGDSILVNNRAYCIHPFGISFSAVLSSLASSTPSDTELANPTNWAKVVQDKAIGMALLKHKI